MYEGAKRFCLYQGASSGPVQRLRYLCAFRRGADDSRKANLTSNLQNTKKRKYPRRAMPQISAQEFGSLPLRVHDFLAGVPLHDVWAIDLPRTRPGITLDEFLRKSNESVCKPSPAVRALLNLRLSVGRLFGWDREPARCEAFASRLTAADSAKSLVPPGTREGMFRVVYRFENEQLLEIINRTVHGAALSTLVETDHAYRFYFAVYVRSVGRLTPLYMALIDPFRKLIVYPSLLRTIRARWNQAFGTG